MITGYFQVAWPAGYEQVPPTTGPATCMVVVAALAVILAGGWFLTQSLGDLAWQQVRKSSLAHNQTRHSTPDF